MHQLLHAGTVFFQAASAVVSPAGMLLLVGRFPHALQVSLHLRGVAWDLQIAVAGMPMGIIHTTSAVLSVPVLRRSPSIYLRWLSKYGGVASARQLLTNESAASSGRQVWKRRVQL